MPSDHPRLTHPPHSPVPVPSRGRPGTGRPWSDTTCRHVRGEGGGEEARGEGEDGRKPEGGRARRAAEVERCSFSA
eukprot:767776-Hanusia_phi.AAC.1